MHYSGENDVPLNTRALLGSAVSITAVAGSDDGFIVSAHVLEAEHT